MQFDICTRAPNSRGSTSPRLIKQRRDGIVYVHTCTNTDHHALRLFGLARPPGPSVSRYFTAWTPIAGRVSLAGWLAARECSDNSHLPPNSTEHLPVFSFFLILFFPLWLFGHGGGKTKMWCVAQQRRLHSVRVSRNLAALGCGGFGWTERSAPRGHTHTHRSMRVLCGCRHRHRKIRKAGRCAFAAR
ncbi:hypothetical protein EDB81DRAFT_262036 [Dactylonectria macrodidyma]|uniref:Uncharacterized protein n=1 Tax=Dactylonectria macrodidyma TaxID=307937 RepID=A0A9P9FKN7_9HYPO|nr:hypothetical protein EDB81DRAFT_262036 [Dactylonectria macrodidyma]